MVRDRAVCTAVSSHFDLGKCSGSVRDRARGRRGDRRRDQRRAQLCQPVYHQRNKVRLAEDTHFRVYARCCVFDLLSDRAGNTFGPDLNKNFLAYYTYIYCTAPLPYVVHGMQVFLQRKSGLRHCICARARHRHSRYQNSPEGFTFGAVLSFVNEMATVPLLKLNT